MLQDCYIHTAHLLGKKIVKYWQQENDFRYLENWPSQSPDLNLIEKLRHDIKTELKRRQRHNHREFANNVRDVLRRKCIRRLLKPGTRN